MEMKIEVWLQSEMNYIMSNLTGFFYWLISWIVFYAESAIFQPYQRYWNIKDINNVFKNLPLALLVCSRARIHTFLSAWLGVRLLTSRKVMSGRLADWIMGRLPYIPLDTSSVSTGSCQNKAARFLSYFMYEAWWWYHTSKINAKTYSPFKALD